MRSSAGDAAFEALVQAMPVAVVVCDAGGRLTFANEAWRRTSRAPFDELDEVAAWKVVVAYRPDGSRYAADELPLARSVRAGAVIRAEPVEFHDADGVRTTEVSSAPILDEDGTVVAGVAVSVDVTTHRQDSNERADRRARQAAQGTMEQIFDFAGDGIWVLDADGRTVLINPAARRMTGWDPEDIVGEVSHFIIHHSHADGSEYPIEECPIYRSVNFGERCSVDGEVFWRKDGTSFPVAYTSTPIYDGERQNGAVQVFRDLTEERTAEAERRRISEAEQARRRAFEVNDTIVQRLAVAEMAFDLGRDEQGRAAVRQALEMSKRLINDWAGEGGLDLTRSAPADRGLEPG